VRVAVVFFSRKREGGVAELAKALARGIESQGHQVDVIDSRGSEDKKLTMYQYIAVGTEQLSFLGKISEQIAPYLANHGILNGKKSFAFVPLKTFGAQRALLSLMKSMEDEGMLVKNSYTMKTPEVAREIGKKLHIAD